MTDIEVIEKASAFRRRMRTYVLQNINHIDPTEFFKAAFKIFKAKICEALQTLRVIKVNVNLEMKFKRNVNLDAENIVDMHDGDSDGILPFFWQTRNKRIIATTNLEMWYKENVVDEMMSKIDETQENGSGWTLTEISEMTININKYVMFTASGYIPVPDDIDRNHSAIVNVKNKDEKCFLWSVLSALHPVGIDASNVKQYKQFENELNLDGITFPVSLNDIKK